MKNEIFLEKVRLQKYLASCGIGSRRQCEKYIQDGRVSVNGENVTNQGIKVSEQDSITFDNKIIKPILQKVYIMLNKPIGYVCTNYDPYEKNYARELIKENIKNTLFSIGRLDKNTSGLILFTNDGDFAQMITHPSNKIEKEYVVLTSTNILEKDLDYVLKNGITDSGVTYHIKRYDKLNSNSVHITLTEGKKREIRKIFSFLGYTILELQRIRIGTLLIGDLHSGAYRYLHEYEIRRLKELK